jgi:hypothetical protein
MFSFFSGKPSSRFESCKELRPLLPVMNQLRKQVNVLNTAANANGPDSWDARKYTILEALLSDMEQAIDRFNDGNDVATSLDADIINLINELAKLISVEHFGGKLQTLHARRNDYRVNVNYAIDYGTTFTAIAVACGWPLTFPVGCLAIAGASMGNSLFREVTDISNLTTRSVRIIIAFHQALSQIEDNIENKHKLVIETSDRPLSNNMA